jgi:hypothetical protein
MDWNPKYTGMSHLHRAVKFRWAEGRSKISELKYKKVIDLHK